MAIVIPFGNQPNKRGKDAPLLPVRAGGVVDIKSYLADKASGLKEIQDNNLIMAHLARDYIQSSAFRTEIVKVYPEGDDSYIIVGDTYPGFDQELSYVTKFFFKEGAATDESVQFLAALIALAPRELEVHDTKNIDDDILDLLRIIFEDEVVFVF